MPTPASHPELQRLASPVPRYSVLPVGSFGSAVSAPTEFCRSVPSSQVHAGSAANPSSVRQTPPPETPTQSLQLPGVQVGAISIAVTRLAVVSVEPENAITPGCCAMLSDAYGSQWLFHCELSGFAIFVNVARAFETVWVVYVLGDNVALAA